MYWIFIIFLIPFIIIFFPYSFYLYFSEKNDGYFVIEGSDVKTPIRPNPEFHKHNARITELELPKNVEYVYCSHNYITELNLPEGVEFVFCFDNNIKKLIIPKKTIRIECERNQITQLSIPESVIRLDCDLMNGIEEQYKKRMTMKIYQKR